MMEAAGDVVFKNLDPWETLQVQDCDIAYNDDRILMEGLEDVKVKSVKLKATKNTSNGCGIDGELLRLNGQVICSLHPKQCHLIGRPARERLTQQ
ncbi:hypothetical protein HPP92_028224 [Vanilla planifolia]|uniref:Uncharacterized protein n=1 Tax=Vanilla planifolia TaxID=51239 RepID=A0A835P9V5_VANPL|nr:hypothetical protein HPP92_028224 [Vanilla planifolia]KAG0447746.1 hypothetical protein HPP92_028194 [Vanilla planifolia]